MHFRARCDEWRRRLLRSESVLQRKLQAHGRVPRISLHRRRYPSRQEIPKKRHSLRHCSRALHWSRRWSGTFSSAKHGLCRRRAVPLPSSTRCQQLYTTVMAAICFLWMLPGGCFAHSRWTAVHVQVGKVSPLSYFVRAASTPCLHRWWHCNDFFVLGG